MWKCESLDIVRYLLTNTVTNSNYSISLSVLFNYKLFEMIAPKLYKICILNVPVMKKIASENQKRL